MQPVGPGVAGGATRPIHVPGEGAYEARVLSAIEDEVLHIDAVTARTGLRAAEVTAALASLEIRGLVRQFPGKHFARCRVSCGASAGQWLGRRRAEALE